MDGCFCRLIIRRYGENCDPPESFSVNDILTSLSDTFYDRFAQKTLLFFVENGWDDEYGGLFEVLKSNGESKAIPFRRVMVHARQLFVFSRWAKLTGNNKFSAKADKIFEFMITAFWDFENGGWFSKLNLDGSVQNQTKDLYAHAFVLFGLANYKNSLDRKTTHDWIDKTLTIIERQFSRKDGSFCQDLSGDFVDLSPQIRSQNPHMHLLEAVLYLLENDKQNSRYLTLVNRLLNLFESKILDSENNFFKCITSGSKGNAGNILQIMGVWGQSLLMGSRIKKSVEQRTLPHFHYQDDTPEARGFIKNSYLSGLKGNEFNEKGRLAY